jgi:hypothetical protein
MAYQAAETAAKERVQSEEGGPRPAPRDARQWARVTAMKEAADLIGRWNPPPGVAVSVALRFDHPGPAEVGFMLDACCSEASGLIPAGANTAEIGRILDGAATLLLLQNARAHAEKEKTAGSFLESLSMVKGIPGLADILSRLNT